ncbi:uncharacterized protein LOC116023759 [Ipomoea triloba]|uniref:uncharacterized protein LOC116023759 n=1 Tax=Ipomoea triloba TaxID=35885 RepID=UPI00125D4A99|nr:uncharacterized protein LOC116023759 [Ipomoea triloba]
MIDEIDLVSDDEEEADDDIDINCPVIRLSREEKVRLWSKLKQTLIVKVMGRSMGYGYLLRRLTSLWRPKARMELVTVDNRYFLVKFASLDDLEFAKYGGLWMVMDHYLIVKEWIPNFDLFTDKTESMIVGVSRPINIDTATSMVSRASFARVCVEVDITKSLPAKFTFRNKVRPVVYEGLHLICFKCKMYGHNAGGCHLNPDGNASTDAAAGGDHRMENAPDADNGHNAGKENKQRVWKLP